MHCADLVLSIVGAV